MQPPAITQDVDHERLTFAVIKFDLMPVEVLRSATSPTCNCIWGFLILVLSKEGVRFAGGPRHLSNAIAKHILGAIRNKAQ